MSDTKRNPRQRRRYQRPCLASTLGEPAVRPVLLACTGEFNCYAAPAVCCAPSQAECTESGC